MNFRRKQRVVSYPNQDGSLLLLSVVVLGVIAFSAIYLSFVLLNEIKSTRFADNSIISYYVGESGAEDALWRLKRAKETGTISFFTSLAGKKLCAAEEGSSETNCDSAAGGDPERFFDYATVSTAASDYMVYDVQRNTPSTLDIYDPAKEGLAGQTTGVSQINIDWYLERCTPTDAASKLEISYVPINIETLEVFGSQTDPTTYVDVCGCSSADATTGLYKCGDPPPAFSNSFSVSTGKFYRITFRSLDTDVKRLAVTTNAGAGVPSQIEVRSSGIYRESESLVTLRAAWKDALSGIFNYVLFSEENLIKDTPSDASSAFGSLCGMCTSSNLPCSTDSDCGGSLDCNIINTENFCSDTSGESYIANNISQTDAGSCNALCNGLTYCGDAVVQSLNGAGVGGSSGNGDEECDAGSGNSNTQPNTCRLDCRNPWCGDGVQDTGEECDDSNTANNDGCSSVCLVECSLDADLDTFTLCGADGSYQTTADNDCVDSNALVNPNAVEGPQGNPTCSDALDNDCDGTLDGADASCGACVNVDNDGYDTCDVGGDGLPADCNDNNSGINPGITEDGNPGGECDALDNDCDGVVDELPTCVAQCTTQLAKGGWTLHDVESEEPPTYAATKAFDGLISTLWHSKFTNPGSIDDNPNHFSVNLGVPRRLCGFGYLPRQDGAPSCTDGPYPAGGGSYVNGDIENYQVQVSTDGTSWTPVASGVFYENCQDILDNYSTVQNAEFIPVNMQYVRFIGQTEWNNHPQATNAGEIYLRYLP